MKSLLVLLSYDSYANSCCWDAVVQIVLKKDRNSQYECKSLLVMREKLAYIYKLKLATCRHAKLVDPSNLLKNHSCISSANKLILPSVANHLIFFPIFFNYKWWSYFLARESAGFMSMVFYEKASYLSFYFSCVPLQLIHKGGTVGQFFSV